MEMIRALEHDEIDLVAGGPSSVSDGLGLALGGVGLIGASIGTNWIGSAYGRGCNTGSRIRNILRSGRCPCWPDRGYFGRLESSFTLPSFKPAG